MQTGALLQLACLLAFVYLSQAAIQMAGVNLAGAEFGEATMKPDDRGTYNTNYTYPPTSEVDYYVSKGMNIFRLPFRWERIQQTLGATFDTAEQNRLVTLVNYMTNTKGAYCLLDPHNYARYDKEVIGASSVTVEHFQDFWAKLATLFSSNNKVIFGLMNEPNTMSTTLWRDNAQAAITAIRATGAQNLIFVPGNAWTGAHSWLSNSYGTPNAEAMITITDPFDNFVFEVHQYLDSDSSGTSEVCTSSTIGSERLAAFTGWLRTNNKTGFLGEFGGSSSSTCLQAVDDMLTYIDQNSDVWVGWTWWAGGPWWSADYFMLLEPANGQDKPQMEPLARHAATIQQTTGGTTGSGTTTGSSSSTTGASTSTSTSTTGQPSFTTTGMPSTTGRRVVIVYNVSRDRADDDGSDAGTIAGATIGCIAGVGLVAGGAFLFVKKRDVIRDKLQRGGRGGAVHKETSNSTEMGLQKASSPLASPATNNSNYNNSNYNNNNNNNNPPPANTSVKKALPPPATSRPANQPRRDMSSGPSAQNLSKPLPTPPPKPTKQLWKEYFTDEGHKYYYNEQTGESRWEKP